MISLSTAVEIVVKETKNLDGNQMVPLWQSLGRVLSSSIYSDINMPPFNKSAVDGYACRREDLNAPLRVIEVIAAGKMPEHTITSGCCSKIMTGAPIPEGADCVIMVEEVEVISNETVRFVGKDTKSNIALFAEDVRFGDTVLPKGTQIAPQHIAILAAVGISKVPVTPKPRVAVLITGDELVETEQKPALGQIRNSNGHQLYTQIIRAGAEPVYGGIVEDTPEATKQAIAKALDQCDIVILTGGVSMGDFDFVPKVITELGVDIKFQTIAVQPGKPTVFGTNGSKLVFGLPGNPVSSFLQFEILVKTAIKAMMGQENPAPKTIKIPLASSYKRKRSERLALVPACYNKDGEIEAISYHGSAHIFALAKATAVFEVPIGVDNLSKGELVDVRPL